MEGEREKGGKRRGGMTEESGDGSMCMGGSEEGAGYWVGVEQGPQASVPRPPSSAALMGTSDSTLSSLAL